MDIQSGDVVALKSGGPKMTVTKVTESDDVVSCIWFDQVGDPTNPVWGKIQEGRFTANILEHRK